MLKEQHFFGLKEQIRGLHLQFEIGALNLVETDILAPLFYFFISS